MKSFKIKNIEAREILDSRGNPTIEVGVKTGFGIFKASVPSGASTGKHEAVELRDGGKRYSGKGVLKAIKNIEKIILPELKGKDVRLQKEIDNLMIKIDGTENKSRLGGNSMCAVSLAVCRAAAISSGLELFQYVKKISKNTYKISGVKNKMPLPSFNIINGGAHAGNRLDIQEFMIAPQGKSFSENLRIATEIYHQLKLILSKKYGKQATNLGDEGGFAPPLLMPEQALNLILLAARKLNYQNKIKIILDVAASEFFEKGKYKMQLGVFTKEGLLRYYLKLVSHYPIMAIEDPFAEDDWDSFKEITKKLDKKVLIIGDDLLVTNPKRIKTAIEKKAANAMILKINQIGTVSEAFESVKLARQADWKIMVSHRSGETNDDFIADFAVGIGADFIKTGAPARGERLVKYNRLLKIEEKIKL